MKNHYEVIVSNIGYVHAGHNKDLAIKYYKEYCEISKVNYGRGGGENVILMVNNEIEKEYIGHLAASQYP